METMKLIPGILYEKLEQSAIPIPITQ